jgi:hypothetical protein
MLSFTLHPVGKAVAQEEISKIAAELQTSRESEAKDWNMQTHGWDARTQLIFD